MKKRPDGRWMKKKTIDGKQVFFYSSAATEKQAEKDFEKQFIEYVKKEHVNKNNFKMLAERAIKDKELTTGYKNIESYTVAFKHLKSLYEKDITEIKPTMVQKIMDDMSKKGYSFSSIHKVKTLISVIYDYAIVNEDVAANNFIRSIKIPKNAKKGEVKAPPEFVRDKIIEKANDSEFGLWALMLMSTGLRRGEQAAIQKRDIDFEKNEIDLKHSVAFEHNQPVLKDRLKSDESKNTVPLLETLKPYLIEKCKNLKPEEFVFGKTKPLTETQIKDKWKNYCNEIGYKFNGHQLRHAYALMLYEAGVDVKTAQRLLRHADIRTTMNIYTEFSKKVTDESIIKINEYFKKMNNKSSQKVVKKAVSNGIHGF